MLPLVARTRTLGISMALAIASAGVFTAAPAAANASTWNVQAGNFEPMTFTSIEQEITTFYPARITVHAGDDVLFTPIGFHTVTVNPVRFPGEPTILPFTYADPAYRGFSNNPLTSANAPGGATLNSGGFGAGDPNAPPGPSSYTLHVSDNAAGGSGTTYQYFCMLHRDMTGWITVLPKDASLPSTDLQNQVRANRAMKKDIARGKRALARATENSEDNQSAAGLGLASVQGAGATAILRFAPARIEINVGESVTWINKDINAPHTVTFGVELPGPPGAPPGFLPYGGTTISSTTDQANSGFLVSQELIDYLNVSSIIPPGFVVTRQVTFTFTKAGTYSYFCALHDTLGMVGTIVVGEQDNNDNHGD